MIQTENVFSYGVRYSNTLENSISECVESVRNNGFAVLKSPFNTKEIAINASRFEDVQKKYISKWGEGYLKSIDEFDIVRLPMEHDIDGMLGFACQPQLLSVIGELIDGSYILNQQNLITNPAKENYSQTPWHRDLPYQHFVSTKPLAINALYCVDDFTIQNGASFVIPGSHKVENFPSRKFIENNELQIEAKAGSYLILDCMTFHRGGYNSTDLPRRAINHVFTIPYFKQQISIPENLDLASLPLEKSKILGLHNQQVLSVQGFFDTKLNK